MFVVFDLRTDVWILRGSQYYEVEKRQVRTEEDEESEGEEERRGTGTTRTSQTAGC